MNFIRAELLFDIRTRQITDIEQLPPHINAFTASNEGGGVALQNQREFSSKIVRKIK